MTNIENALREEQFLNFTKQWYDKMMDKLFKYYGTFFQN